MTHWRVEPPASASSYWAKHMGDNDVGTATYGLPSQLFPSDNWWNLDISSAPIDTNSSDIIANWPQHGIGSGYQPFAGWNGDTNNGYGIPICTIGGGTPEVDSGDVIWVEFSYVSYGSESDYSGNGSAAYQGKFPIPVAALTETTAGHGLWTETQTDLEVQPSGDRHMCIVDVDTGYLYEVYQPFFNNASSSVELTFSPGNYIAGYQWACASCAVWDMSTNNYRTNGWTSTDAAGLQIAPGLVRYDELMSANPIAHAIRYCQFHGRDSMDRSVWPATHYADRFNDNYPPTGTRLRLEAAYDASSETAEAQKIIAAMKTYGLICADFGCTGWIDLIGTPDGRWGQYDSALRQGILNAFANIDKNDFDVIEADWGAPDPWTNLP